MGGRGSPRDSHRVQGSWINLERVRTSVGNEMENERELESRGMKISRHKTEYMMCTEEEQNRRGSIILDGVDGSEDKEVTSRIQAGWKSWRDVSGVLCDRKMPVKLKGKVYKTVVRPAMTYGAEALPLKKVSEKKMEVAEMRMLRWMCGVTREDRIRNTRIRGTVKVTEISKKTQEARLRWYGHVARSNIESDERRALDMEVQGRRRRGRPKTIWKDCIISDMRIKELDNNMAVDRNRWRRLIRNSDPV